MSMFFYVPLCLCFFVSVSKFFLQPLCLCSVMFHCVYVLWSISLFVCSTISVLHCVYVPMYLYSIATVFHVCVLHCVCVLHVYTPPCLLACGRRVTGCRPPSPALAWPRTAARPPGPWGVRCLLPLAGLLGWALRQAYPAWPYVMLVLLGITSCLSCLTLRHGYPAWPYVMLILHDLTSCLSCSAGRQGYPSRPDVMVILLGLTSWLSC